MPAIPPPIVLGSFSIGDGGPIDMAKNLAERAVLDALNAIVVVPALPIMPASSTGQTSTNLKGGG